MDIKIILLLLSVIAVTQTTALREVVCYYIATIGRLRTGNGYFTVNDINPNLCTQIVYGFAMISDTYTVVPADPWFEENDMPWRQKNFEEFMKLKTTNPNVKLLIGVGNYRDGQSARFSAMASNSTFRSTFTSSCQAFINKWGFDGMVLYWNAPTTRGGIVADKINFPSLLQVLYNILSPAGKKLAILTSCIKNNLPNSYRLANIHPRVDYIHLMTYDFFKGSPPRVSHHTSVFNTVGDGHVQTADICVRFWLNNGFGAPRHKLIIGLATYGRTYTLTNSSLQSVGSPASGLGPAGPITNRAGILAYYEICSNTGLTRSTDNDNLGAIAVSGTTWIGYDTPATMGMKGTWIINQQFGGAFVMPLDTDDFKGTCGTAYPLLSRIYNNLTTTALVVTTTTPAP